jgi:hypothetical protein
LRDDVFLELYRIKEIHASFHFFHFGNVMLGKEISIDNSGVFLFWIVVFGFKKLIHFANAERDLLVTFHALLLYVLHCLSYCVYTHSTSQQEFTA